MSRPIRRIIDTALPAIDKTTGGPLNLADLLTGLGGQSPLGGLLSEPQKRKRGLDLYGLLTQGQQAWMDQSGASEDPLLARGQVGDLRVAQGGHNKGGVYVPVTVDGERYNVWYDSEGKRTVRRLGAGRER
jgi:hypothetical protein